MLGHLDIPIETQCNITISPHVTIISGYFLIRMQEKNKFPRSLPSKNIVALC